VRILVTGATGLIGCHAAARLARAGHDVRALVRDAEKLQRVLAPLPAGDAVTSQVGDVIDPASVAVALRGCDALLHCAGFFSHDLSDAARLQEVNVRGTRLVLNGACELGLARIVLVSSTLALFPPPGPRLRASDPVASPRTMYAATKAEAERWARGLQQIHRPVSIVYPSSVLGPHDPTVGSGPGVLAAALRAGRVLVTDGGLAHTDVRDLADLLAALFAANDPPPRAMATASFVPHARYFELLGELTGRVDLAAQRIPGAALRALGRAGDWTQRWLGRPTRLTHEAALVLTRGVPVEDDEARALLGREPIPFEDSLRDTLVWMAGAGILEPRHVGRLAPAPMPLRSPSARCASADSDESADLPR
jgi:dihydroflavonol-4-reductase